MSEHILIVDASGFAFRSFYTFPPCYRESDGQPVGAIIGFMAMLFRLRGDAEAISPKYAVCVFDAPGKNFRHDLFPQYKANRAGARDLELSAQMPFMRHAAETIGFAVRERAGFEADDVIATIATNAYARGISSTIVSSDKDFGQLVEDGRGLASIDIVDPMKKQRFKMKEIRYRWGVEPHQVPDVQALCGDAADGIPGVDKCGRDTAAKIIRRFGSVEGVLNNLAQLRFAQVRHAIARDPDRVALFKKLTTLNRNIPDLDDFDNMKADPIFRSHIERMLKTLGATSRMQALFGLDEARMRRTVEAQDDPLEWWREELVARGQRIPDEPQAGFYMRRLVKNGPFVGARIWRDHRVGNRESVLCALGRDLVDPFSEWARLAMNPITRAEYEKLMKSERDPRRAIDLREIPAISNQESET